MNLEALAFLVLDDDLRVLRALGLDDDVLRAARSCSRRTVLAFEDVLEADETGEPPARIGVRYEVPQDELRARSTAWPGLHHDLGGRGHLVSVRVRGFFVMDGQFAVALETMRRDLAGSGIGHLDGVEVVVLTMPF